MRIRRPISISIQSGIRCEGGAWQAAIGHGSESLLMLWLLVARRPQSCLCLRVGGNDHDEGAHLIRTTDHLDTLILWMHDDAGIAAWLLPDKSAVWLHGGLPQMLLHLITKLVWCPTEAAINGKQLASPLWSWSSVCCLQPQTTTTITSTRGTNLDSSARVAGRDWLVSGPRWHRPLCQLRIRALSQTTDLDPLSIIKVGLAAQPFHLHLALPAECKTKNTDWNEGATFWCAQWQW
mmetsp:Transcript_130928/g.330551  ORF Transcript_130928/g.330551 Transcript_130928/m.330551 type:complete len:236 (+) Transcript_130928:487-1194(+)